MLRLIGTVLIFGTSGCTVSSSSGSRIVDEPVPKMVQLDGRLSANVEVSTEAEPLTFVTQSTVVAGGNGGGFSDGVLNPTNGAMVETSDVTLTIQPDTEAEGNYVLTLTSDGEIRRYSDGDGRERGFYGDNYFINTPAYSASLTSLDGDWNDVFTGNAAFVFLNRISEDVVYFQPGVSSRIGYLVVGVPTAELPISGFASYTGHLNGWIDYEQSPTGDGEFFDEDRFRLGMDLTLNAEFDGGITGDLTNVRRDGVPIAGAFTIEEATLSEDGFAARVVDNQVACNTDCLSLDTSTLSGRLFGPNADEAGGIAALTGTDPEGNSFVAAGAWAATKD